MKYVDGFVATVPTAKKEEFIEHCKTSHEVAKECGALSIVECWGDDVPDGKLTSFPMAVQKRDDETVIFSWIMWPNKAARDENMKKVHEDPRMQEAFESMPIDGARIIFGGFEVVLES